VERRRGEGAGRKGKEGGRKKQSERGEEVKGRRKRSLGVSLGFTEGAGEGNEGDRGEEFATNQRYVHILRSRRREGRFLDLGG